MPGTGISIRYMEDTKSNIVIKAGKAPGIKSAKTKPYPISGIRVKVPQYSPAELLDRYVRSEEFRKCMDSGRYVFAEGYMVLRSKDCIEVRDGQIFIKDSIRDKLEDYCIHVERKRRFSGGDVPRSRPGIAFRWQSRGDLCEEIKDAGKFSQVSVSDWEKLFETGVGKSLPYEFGEALGQLMKEKKMIGEQLAEYSGLSVRTITRLRTGENKPSLPTVIAISIGLSLDPFLAEQLLSIAGYSLTGKKADRVMKMVLDLSFGITISEANDILGKMGLPGLCKNIE